MSVVIPMEHQEHSAVQALLPWYVRGQLDDDDMGDVRRHLLHCQTCRNELAAEQPMQALLNMAGVLPEGGDAEAGLAKLHARMQPVKSKAATPRWMPWALGLQGTAVVLLLGLWLQARQDNPADDSAYRGLSDAASTPVVADALVMFKADTSEQALREQLQAQGADIVAGPTATGAYLLRVDPRGLTALRGSPIVAMAEPLQPGPAR